MQIVRKNVLDRTLRRHLPRGQLIAKMPAKNRDRDYCINTIETAPP
jgi:hypothetical protein